MPESFADFLDDLNEHIEREMAKVSPSVAESLLHSDTPLSTAELLRILARSEKQTGTPEQNESRGAHSEVMEPVGARGDADAFAA